ncbi:hypothetical protein A3724_00305 [Alcanivorax sp. HI0033]|jgi:hypothetical protein|nr:hypothetical protein A3724_00305 [Alcanivorax sp. HI0033]
MRKLQGIHPPDRPPNRFLLLTHLYQPAKCKTLMLINGKVRTLQNLTWETEHFALLGAHLGAHLKIES